MDKKYCYIAAPYSKGDAIQNVRAAIMAADKLARRGYYPHNPLLYHFWHFIFPHDYRFWMDQDKAWLLKCDYLIRLAGESSGADEEVAIAMENNIKVFYGMADFFGDVVE